MKRQSIALKQKKGITHVYLRLHTRLPDLISHDGYLSLMAAYSMPIITNKYIIPVRHSHASYLSPWVFPLFSTPVLTKQDENQQLIMRKVVPGKLDRFTTSNNCNSSYSHFKCFQNSHSRSRITSEFYHSLYFYPVSLSFIFTCFFLTVETNWLDRET